MSLQNPTWCPIEYTYYSGPPFTSADFDYIQATISTSSITFPSISTGNYGACITSAGSNYIRSSCKCFFDGTLNSLQAYWGNNGSNIGINDDPINTDCLFFASLINYAGGSNQKPTLGIGVVMNGTTQHYFATNLECFDVGETISDINSDIALIKVSGTIYNIIASINGNGSVSGYKSLSYSGQIDISDYFVGTIDYFGAGIGGNGSKLATIPSYTSNVYFVGANLSSACEGEPMVSFYTTPTSANAIAPVGISFNNTSTPKELYTDWNWDFGDGTSGSTDKHPLHLYTSAGIYNVSVSGTTSAGIETTIQPIQIFQAVEINYDYVTVYGYSEIYPVSGIAPIAISFINERLLSGTPTVTVSGSNFGTERIGLANVKFSNGLETVVTDEYDSWTNTQIICKALLTSGYWNAIVTTSGGSTTTISSAVNVTQNYINNLIFDDWLWDFGDGTSGSTDRHPMHLYLSAGNYNVSLSAITSGSDLYTYTLPIVIGQAYKEFDFIELWGARGSGRFGPNKLINLVNFLPDFMRGSQTEIFLSVFENCLNNMFIGIDGYNNSETAISYSTSSTSGDYDHGEFKHDHKYYNENFSSAINYTDATTIDTSNLQINSNTETISILEKIKRLTELQDPTLIDLDYIQFFAKNLGYNIDIYREEVVGDSFGNLGTLDNGSINQLDQEKYLRFVVENLPNWYKIKTTKNCIKIMLYSFGLIGDIVELYSKDYSDTEQDWNYDTGNLENINNTWYPTPHFAIKINIDRSDNISVDISKKSSMIRAIESIRPINTVFRKLSGVMERSLDLYIGGLTRISRYIEIGSPTNYPSDYFYI